MSLECVTSGIHTDLVGRYVAITVAPYDSHAKSDGKKGRIAGMYLDHHCGPRFIVMLQSGELVDLYMTQFVIEVDDWSR